ncbi:hydroxyacid dehydrogenase [Sagittula salina]|uniref:Hydroxyacid dehydrogenase n=1 Tax=Sagittula salina TaxID=2820268 RepID=A0A940MIN5_9RHOB|nr:hydroxyacid dehydrogenase [Sagittula salina]MBP0482216.1 hydroxyacid dehydrogenase [Sagittula salina]
MPHVLVAGKLHPLGRAVLDAAPGITAHYIDEISEDSYAPHIAQADALLIRTQPLSAATVARADRLRFVSRHGVGYDAVDVAALNARGIALAVCGDVNSTAVAEHACMMILAAAKRALRGDRAVRSGPWDWRNTLESQDIRGRTLLILGYGRIGQHVARMMAGFGLTILAYDPWLAQHGWPDGPATSVTDLDDALGQADILSVSAPKGNRPLIGAAEFARMKPGAILVNTARGGIVDEAALVDALRSGKVGAAGLDVFAQEPPAPANPLLGFDQVILSPHIAGVTEGAAERMAVSSAQNILDFLAGRLDPALIVNRDALRAD